MGLQAVTESVHQFIPVSGVRLPSVFTGHGGGSPCTSLYLYDVYLYLSVFTGHGGGSASHDGVCAPVYTCLTCTSTCLCSQDTVVGLQAMTESVHQFIPV